MPAAGNPPFTTAEAITAKGARGFGPALAAEHNEMKEAANWGGLT
jgi:hypothetical protein